ncbi:MAG: Hsp20/alpha crystallin family protein [Chloroflexi bacterium]|nr:Hsp20/alpha crystallin family protein [Chloroflexota bacterium]
MVALMIRRPSRALTVSEPFFRPWSVLDETDRMLREFWHRPTWVTGDTFPVDVYEDKDVLVVKAEIPGMTKDDIDISFEGDVLNIKAEKKADKLEGITAYTCERYYGSLFRSVTLPFPVDTDKVLATYENGLLEITLPKAEAAKTKHVSIK